MPVAGERLWLGRGSDAAGAARLWPARLGLTLAALILLGLSSEARAAEPAEPLGSVTEYTVPTPAGEPTGIAAGPDGSLWFTERAADKIGRVTPGGQFTEFQVPTPAAEPTGIVAGPDGDIWFTEMAADKIGLLTPSGQFTEYPVLGTGTEPTTIAAGPNGELCQLNCDRSLWITQPGAGVMSEFLPDAGEDNHWLYVNWAERLRRPLAIAAGPEGELWYTDPEANTVGEVSPEPHSMGLSTPVPIPTEGSEPDGIALGPHGQMWFTEEGAGEIGSFGPRTRIITELPIPTRTGRPSAITEGPDGDMWFTEEAAGQIGRVTTDGEFREFPIPAAAATPSGIVAGPDGDLWFADPADDAIGRISPGPAPPRNTALPTSSGMVEQGQSLTAEPGSWTGDLSSYEYQWESCTPAGTECEAIPGATDASHELTEGDVGHALRVQVTATNDAGTGEPASSMTTGVVAATGELWAQVTEFPLPDAPGDAVGEPEDITEGADGNMWFVEWTGKVARITPAGRVTEFTVPNYSRNLQGIAAGPDGNLWFAERYVGNIDSITTKGVISRYSIPSFGGEPDAIAAGRDGNLWFVEGGQNKIARLSPQGAITEFSIPTAESRPDGVVAGAHGDIWFSEETGNKIGRITPSGQITEFPTPTAESQPAGLVAGPDGDIWFAEHWAGKIGRITPSGQITEFDLGTGSWPDALALGPDGNVWFTERWANKIGRITPEGEVEVVEPSVAESQPTGIAAGPNDSIWFTEASGHRVARIDLTQSSPRSLRAPQLEGTAAVGKQLTASPGAWSHKPTSYAYEWERCDPEGDNCSPIEAAEGAGYVVSTADVDRTIRVQVTATNAFGESKAADSEPSARVIDESPEIVITTSTAVVEGASAPIALECVGGTPKQRCEGKISLQRAHAHGKRHCKSHRSQHSRNASRCQVKKQSFGRRRFSLRTGTGGRFGLLLPLPARALLSARRRLPVQAIAAMSRHRLSGRRVLLLGSR